MKLSRIYSLVLWLALLIIFSSCQRPEIISERKVFDNQIWNRFEIVEFNFNITKPDMTYDVTLNFEHIDKYYTDHLTTNITFYMPDGSMRSRDYTFKLKNEKLEWLGSTENKTISHQLPVVLGMKFPEVGSYEIRVESKMTKFNLENIKAVGLNIKPSE
ncbi:MAG: gliding motility lipoprotein GldH [Bacteroidales bacterium]|nr:gliding motility lipoprotein GldH [Bacteroidales bacterium]